MLRLRRAGVIVVDIPFSPRHPHRHPLPSTVDASHICHTAESESEEELLTRVMWRDGDDGRRYMIMRDEKGYRMGP